MLAALAAFPLPPPMLAPGCGRALRAVPSPLPMLAPGCGRALRAVPLPLPMLAGVLGRHPDDERVLLRGHRNSYRNSYPRAPRACGNVPKSALVKLVKRLPPV